MWGAGVGLSSEGRVPRAGCRSNRALKPGDLRVSAFSFNAPLKGTIEADTTFVGGKEKNKHAADREGGTQGGAGKEIVLGVIEREGELRAEHIADAKAKTVHGYVKANVAKGSALMTDEDRSFLGMDGHFDVHAVNHSAGEYVRMGGTRPHQLNRIGLGASQAADRRHPSLGFA
jgi:hypothetical protein